MVPPISRSRNLPLKGVHSVLRITITTLMITMVIVIVLPWFSSCWFDLTVASAVKIYIEYYFDIFFYYDKLLWLW